MEPTLMLRMHVGRSIQAFILHSGVGFDMIVKNAFIFIMEGHFCSYLHQSSWCKVKIRCLGNGIMSMYSKYGNVEGAVKAFSKLPRYLISWNVMILTYISNGDLRRAWRMFSMMPGRGLTLWDSMIGAHGHQNNIIQLPHQICKKGMGVHETMCTSFCITCCNLTQGKIMHACMIGCGCDSIAAICTNILKMYGKFGSMRDARDVFDLAHEQDLLLWSVIIEAYAQSGQGYVAFQLLQRMLANGMVPTKIFIVNILNVCHSWTALTEVRLIHACIFSSGLNTDVFLGNSFLHVYRMFRTLEDIEVTFKKMPDCNATSWNEVIAAHAQEGTLIGACKVFEAMPQPDRVSWNLVIAAHVQYGFPKEAFQLFWQMVVESIEVDKITFLNLLRPCSSAMPLAEGKLIHASIVTTNSIDLKTMIGTAVFGMYGNSGSIEDAWSMFKRLSQQDVVSWTAMIAACTKQGHLNDAIHLFHEMQWAGIKPNKITLTSLLRCYFNPGDLAKARMIHACIIVICDGYGADVLVANALINIYIRCGSLEDAQGLFNQMPHCDSATWTSMITGYGQHGCLEEAQRIFNEMSHLDMPSCTAMISAYAQHGNVDDARKLFDEMPHRDHIAWTAMITAYSQGGYCLRALELFKEMQQAGEEPDRVTFISIVEACANLGALENGILTHEQIANNGFESNLIIGSALINMYGKCGSLDNALEVFYKMSNPNVVSWSAIIAAYAQHGHGRTALHLFQQMWFCGVETNEITFISILSGCSHAGLVDEGHHYFLCMTIDYGITPVADHYNCIVDLLGRAGHLSEAEAFILRMPIPAGPDTWRAFLGACRSHREILRGRSAAEYVIELDPDNTSAYILISSIFAGDGSLAKRLEDTFEVTSMRQCRQL